MRSIFVILVVYFIFGLIKADSENRKGETSVEEDKYGVKFASPCEVCKLVVRELEDRLGETGKTHEVIEMGYSLDAQPKKRKKYAISELRLVESLDDLCEQILRYNIHKERTDSTRFEKGMSTTFKVLHGLVDKGVKVDLGIPFDLWDKPSAEITNMKSQCENLLEKHESAIEKWYFHHQAIPLKKYLCIDRVLKSNEIGCLEEKFIEKQEESSSGKKEL